jgi:hypothetical protein
MALLSRIELQSGIVVESAYLRIRQFSGSKQGINFDLVGYLSKEAFEANKANFSCSHYSFAPSLEDGADNMIKQAYIYLKTLPMYTNAVDA